MKKEEYEMIVANVNLHVEACTKYLGSIRVQSDIKKFTLDQLVKLSEWSRKEMSQMDQVLHAELYHILAANLTPPQRSMFISRLCKWQAYRPDLKRVCSWLGDGKKVNLTNLPEVPAETEYKLTILGDFKLKFPVRDGISSENTFKSEDDEIIIPQIENTPDSNIETQENSKQGKFATVKPDLENQTVKLIYHKENKASVAAILGSLRGLKPSVLMTKMESQTKYGGFDWLGEVADGIYECVLHCNSKNDVNTFTKKFNANNR